MANILITGGAGFIGCAIARELAQHSEHSIVLVDNFSRGQEDEDLQQVLALPNISFIQGDLTKPEFFTTLPVNIEYIYHLAAVIGVRNVLEHPDRVLYVNAISTLYLYEYAKTLPALKRILFSSTSEIYAGTMKHFGVAVPTPESVHLTLDDIRSPRTTYMLSKMYGESIAMNYGAMYNIPSTVVRYHNVYGPRMGFLHVIPEMFIKIRNAAATGEALDVFSPTHTRAFCYVDDAVRATIAVAEAPNTAGEIINIGNSQEEMSIRELVNRISQIMGLTVKFREQPDTPGSPARRCPDTSTIERLTGFRPTVLLNEGIQRTFEWYRSRLDKRHE